MTLYRLRAATFAGSLPVDFLPVPSVYESLGPLVILDRKQLFSGRTGPDAIFKSDELYVCESQHRLLFQHK